MMISASEAHKSSMVAFEARAIRCKAEVERAISEAIDEGLFEVQLDFVLPFSIEEALIVLGYGLESLCDENGAWTRITW